jgi:hypothetical protein
VEGIGHPPGQRFECAIALFDAANAGDPRLEPGPDGKRYPRELLYARRMTQMLERYAPRAPEVVKLAVRAQHIERWKSPRQSYPMDRKGYLQWRANLYELHAETAARLLREAGYDDETIGRVKKALGKRGLKTDPDTQMLEDVTELVFLEHYLLEFAGRKPEYTEEKWLDILRKMWRKMSPEAQAFALAGKVRLPETLLPLIRKAVAGS